MKVYQVKTQKPSTHSIQWEHHLIHFVFYCSLGKRRNVHFKIFIISVFIPAMSQRKILKSHQWTCKFKCNCNFLCLVLFICFFVLLSWLAFGLFLFRCWFLFVIFFSPQCIFCAAPISKCLKLKCKTQVERLTTHIFQIYLQHSTTKSPESEKKTNQFFPHLVWLCYSAVTENSQVALN